MHTPHNAEAEAAVIAGVMLRNETMSDVAATLAPADFGQADHRATWGAMLALHQLRQPIDPVTLEHRLRATDELGLVGGLEGLGLMGGRYASSHHVAYHAGIVADVARRRRLVIACREVADRGSGPVEDETEFIETAEREILAAGERKDSVGHLRAPDVVHDTLEGIFRRMSRKDPVIGIPSGILNLDLMLGGFQRGKLYVIAGRPGHGKSALSGNVVQAAALLRKQDKVYPSLTINLEMGPREIMERHFWAGCRKIPHAPGIHERVRAGKCSADDMRVLTLAADAINKSPISVIDGVGMTASEIVAKARRWRQGQDCGSGRDALVVVDYLQLIRPSGGKSSYNREQEVAAISREMKIMSKELDLPVILLCQLNRNVEARQGNRPQMGDLRESGAIEQDADVIIFVSRPCKYIQDETSPEFQKVRDDAEIIVAKQRDGETGLIKCRYYGTYLSFESAPNSHSEPLQ